jgi:site-specific DNA-methyltransferase (adenine-specific)
MAIPSPFYSENNTRIYQGDCLEVMQALPSQSVGLVVTDPPYMIGPISTYNQAFWGDMMNSARLYAEWYKECKRLLRHDGALWTFLNWKTVPTLIKAATIAELPILSLMVWDKENRGGGHPAGLRGSYELCALMAKPGFKIANNDLTDVWRYRWSSRHTKDHPAEKPVGLLKRIIAESGTRGIVLDPFMGSGSTLVAARELGFPAVGIEQEEKFCRRAVERLGGQYQQSLLAQPPATEPQVPGLFPVLPNSLIINEPPETLSEEEKLRHHSHYAGLTPPAQGRVLKLRFAGAVN